MKITLPLIWGQAPIDQGILNVEVTQEGDIVTIHRWMNSPVYSWGHEWEHRKVSSYLLDDMILHANWR